MIYYSNEARESAMNRIQEVMAKIARIPGNILNNDDAVAAIRYLGDYKDLIFREMKAEKEAALRRSRKENN